jgi:Ca-activated chloride channel homolog
MIYKFIIHNLSFIILLLTPSVFFAQTAHKMLRKGDGEYLSKDYKAAEENYRKANEAERSHKGSFNLGNSIYMQQRYDEAIKQYDDAAGRAKTNAGKASALYNKGNALFWKGNYAEAEKAYKESAVLNPNDQDLKRNMALLKKIKKQEQQKQSKGQNKDNKDNKDKSNEKNKPNEKKDDKQNQDKNDPKNQPQQGQNQEQEQEQEQKQQPNQQNQDVDQNAQNNRPESTPTQDLKKEEAKRMLQIMDDEERKVQQRLKKGKAKPSKSDKDW